MQEQSHSNWKRREATFTHQRQGVYKRATSTDSSRTFVGFKMSSINSAAEMFSIPFSGPKNVGTLEVNFANVGRICVLQKNGENGRETNRGNKTAERIR